MQCNPLTNRFFVQTYALAAAAMLVCTAADAVTFTAFSWEGQIAGFGVEGRFSYEQDDVPADGIVRKDDLLSFDVSFFDPLGNLLRTYADNHKTYNLFNFNYDTAARAVLQDGGFSEPDGIDIGEYRPVTSGQFTGLNLWSRPPSSSVPHLHFDDWGDEFGFPRGFGGHQDVAFFEFTTQELINTGGVGIDYIDNPNSPLSSFGARIVTAPIPLPPTLLLLAGGIGLFGWAGRRHRRAKKHHSLKITAGRLPYW